MKNCDRQPHNVDWKISSNQKNILKPPKGNNLKIYIWAQSVGSISRKKVALYMIQVLSTVFASECGPVMGSSYCSQYRRSLVYANASLPTASTRLWSKIAAMSSIILRKYFARTVSEKVATHPFTVIKVRDRGELVLEWITFVITHNTFSEMSDQ